MQIIINKVVLNYKVDNNNTKLTLFIAYYSVVNVMLFDLSSVLE